MDINLPLILVLLVAVTGAVSLFDLLFLRKQRRADIEQVEKQFASASLDNEKQQKAFNSARHEAAREPTVVEYAKSFFPILAIVFVLRSFIVEPFQIPSESMVPTLEVGDFILVNKFTYGVRLPVIRTKILDINEPQRGDVMVFFPPHDERYFIKRVIGLPGDVVEVKNNILYVNGEEMPQAPIESNIEGRASSQIMDETIGEKTHKMRKNLSPLRDPRTEGRWDVAPGHYFMMGDNRDNSQDSRFWGPVPEQNIVGKAFAVWMHWQEKFKSLPSFGRAGKIQ